MGRQRIKSAKRENAALAAQIRQSRIRLGLNQGQFARIVGGVSQQTVSDWERGKRLRQLKLAFRLVRLIEAKRLPSK